MSLSINKFNAFYIFFLSREQQIITVQHLDDSVLLFTSRVWTFLLMLNSGGCINATCFAPDRVHTPELILSFLFRVRLHLLASPEVNGLKDEK